MSADKPANVWNFMVELEVDGRNTPVMTGPAARDGGFDMTIYIRHDGGVMKALTVTGLERNGELILDVHPDNDRLADEQPASGTRVSSLPIFGFRVRSKR